MANPPSQFYKKPYPFGSETEREADLEIDGGFLRFRDYPTPNDVIKYGLIGVPKTFPLTGEVIDDEMVLPFMASAIADIEMTGLTISPTIFTKTDDFHEGVFTRNYFPVTVNKFPVLEVQDITLYFPHTSSDKPMLKYVIPREWISLDGFTRFNIIASTGLLAPQMTGATYNAPLAIWTNSQYRPNAFTATWQAGFERGKLPYNVWKLIIDKTAYDFLKDIGPVLFPMGSMSVSLDGISQSAQNPGPTLFEHRLKRLERSIAEQMNRILGYYGQTLNIDFAGM